MRRNKGFALIIAAIGLTLGTVGAASAQCALPNTLANGMVADATQVMANFNALVTCLTTVGPAGTTNAIQYNGGSGSFAAVGPLTNGQLLIGSTSSAPHAAALTAGTGITITNGPGTITITATGGGGGGGGLYSQIMSTTPSSSSTGLTTWLNQGSSTGVDTAVGQSINSPSSGSVAIGGRYKLAPTAPYTVTVLFTNTHLHANNAFDGAGIGWYDGSSKLHVLSCQGNSAESGNRFDLEKWSSPTSFVSSDFTSGGTVALPVWLQLRDDGTNVYFNWSQDGVNFQTLFSTTKSSGYLGSGGYANIIFFTYANNSAVAATLLSYSD